MPTPPPPPTSLHNLIFGENKAIAAITFEHVDGKLELGAIFHVPTREEAGKTFYKRLACKITITEDQRQHLIKMFGGFTT